VEADRGVDFTLALITLGQTVHSALGIERLGLSILSVSTHLQRSTYGDLRDVEGLVVRICKMYDEGDNEDTRDKGEAK
jgi:hypothetical protein